jgi:two-component system, OmpR family, sensor histidine kinase BaeS
MQSAVLTESVQTSTGIRPESRALLGVVAVGISVAGLTWRTTDAGPAWLLADTVLAFAIVFGFARGRPGTAGWILAGASLWLAGMSAWRASDWALATALPGSLLALVALALASARRIEARRVAELGITSLDALRAIPSGILDAARTPARAVGASARQHSVSVARGALLGAPIACLFALLLSADAGFRSAIHRILRGSGDGMELGLWTLATTVGVLVAAAVLGRVRGAGETPLPTKTPTHPGPYRAEGDAPAPTGAASPTEAGPRVRPLTWAIVLGQVIVVFAVYVLANVRSLFEGHAYLRAAGTETYAGYVHSGFIQVSMATLLAVACVVGGHLVLRPRLGASSRRGSPPARIAGGWGLVAVELGLLALVGLTLASCVHRLALYEEAYGYTYLRLGVRLLQLGIGGLLTLTAARCLARGTAAWPSALTWSAVLFTVVAGSVDADGWIASHNVARARAGATLDTDYLASLSEDAAGVLPEVAAIDRDTAEYLRSSWQDQRAEHTQHGWRSRRGIGAR